jgi:hypothetical protein
MNGAADVLWKECFKNSRETNEAEKKIIKEFVRRKSVLVYSKKLRAKNETRNQD